MSSSRHILLLSFILLFATASEAQSERQQDMGLIVGAQISADLTGNMSLEAEEEIRFDHNAMQFDRWLTQVGLDYSFLHNRMHVGVFGSAIRRHNDHDYYENRGRLGIDVSYSESIRRFKLSYRTRFTSTFLDEQTGLHRINPKIYWRNQLKATYQMPGSRFKYSLSTELHWPINDPKHHRPDNLRTVFTADYRVSRHHSVAASLRLDDDLFINQPVDRLYVGLCWKMKY